MGDHTCRACVVYCIDFRLHDNLNRFLSEHGLDEDGTDVVRVAGVGLHLARPSPGWNRDFLVTQLEASHRLHHIREIYLVHHEDCGAYGLGKAVGGAEELRIHTKDLRQARTLLEQRFPHVQVLTYFQRLDGGMEKVD